MDDTQQAENPRAVAGNNQDVLAQYRELAEALPDFLRSKHPHLISETAEIAALFRESPAVLETDEQELAMTDLGGRLSKFLKSADLQRKLDKKPITDGEDALERFYKSFTVMLSEHLETLRRRVNAYKDAKLKKEREEREALRQEQLRLEREQREAKERAAREFEELAASQATPEPAAPPPPPPPKPAPMVTGATGAKSGQSFRWVGEIVDVDSLDLNALRPFLKRADLEAAVNRYAVEYEDTKPLTGAKISQKSNTTFRS